MGDNILIEAGMKYEVNFDLDVSSQFNDRKQELTAAVKLEAGDSLSLLLFEEKVILLTS